MLHRRYLNCRPQNSACYNRIICQTVENMSLRHFLRGSGCHAYCTHLRKVTKVTNNCYLSTNALVDAIGTWSCYIKNRATKLDQTEPTTFSKFSTLTRSFLDLFMLHRRYLNCRPQNSACYNRIICQTVENMSLRHFLRGSGCHAYCTHLRKVTKVTNPISDFMFLLTAKSGKSPIRNLFLDSLKGTLSTHPYWSTFNIL